TVTGATQTFTATVTAAQPEADLDLYVVRDDRPTALPLMTLGTEVGTSEGVTVDLAPASYFLVVVDFAGLPTEYGLTSALGAPPAPGPGVAPAPARVGALGDALTRLAEKRAAARAELTDGRRALLLD
ncbi:MAG: hypothetical protein GWN79_10400, partial [Actinobacteria bacterium]|nr:hypothetical protein [Gemmatimonadota bacterium]NIT99199.1 hypothetical protein [Actinomycetota bacterium]NIU19466.1 hypothetical protein [Actinomycetota bacterium]NIV55957.1 hypothetical protein [Actinomycetota bacterium]NIV87380.1 hypothetical protein [Actinomycetota bacterium]